MLAPCWFIGVDGVDGGDTGTRARLQTLDGRTVGHGQTGTSGLGQGIEQAWRHVEQAIAQAFAAAVLAVPPRGHRTLVVGLAGTGRPDLHDAFLSADPGHAGVVLDSDACTMLRRAHGERRGLVVAAGTGSVGAVRAADGMVRIAGGWVFPDGVEAQGDSADGALRLIRAALADLGRDGRPRVTR